MRPKLKYLLPLLQILVAIALLIWSYRWQLALMRIGDMPGPPPSFRLLIAINAPLAVFRAQVLSGLPGCWGDIIFIPAIGMFWYGVSLNIESWQQTRRVLMFSWRPLRLVGDTVLVGVGVFWALLLRAYAFPVLSFTSWLWFVPLTGLPILWASGLILLFGRDFVQCLLPPKG